MQGEEKMKITIEFDQSDIIRADEVNFQGFFLMIQSFAKSLQEGKEKVLREAVDKFVEEKKSAKVETAEKNFNRVEIETQIKQIALDGKDKGASKKIKEIIQSYGVEKLSDVPDDKMIELLQKVQAAV